MLPSKAESRQVRRQRARCQKKAILAEEQQEKYAIKRIKHLLDSVLSEEKINEIAKQVGSQKRQRKLYPLAIVSILMIGCFNGYSNIPIIPLERMCALLRKWFNVNEKPQSLQEAINKKETSDFIKEVMMCIMANEVNKVISKVKKSETRR